MLQTDIIWAEAEKNRLTARSMIFSALDNKPDLIILPEMFTTGFATLPGGLAEKDETTLNWMRTIAVETGAAITGSVAVEKGGRYFNRMYFVKPDQHYTVYDKRHLFTFGGEKENFSPGREKVVIEHAGVRILLQICYDLRFPVFSRNRNDYDLAIYVASWPSARKYAWNTLLRARAIENQCYVAGVNRTGSDPGGHLYGGSILLDYMGQPVAEGSDKEEAIRGHIDTQAMRRYRAKFPALEDADDFELKI